MKMVATSGDILETGCDLIDVTMMRRPDTSWRFFDRQGHTHRWHDASGPAQHYSPSAAYSTPTLTWVKDGEEYWPDADEPHAVGHLECSLCGEHIQPRYTSDENRQYIPGIRWFLINGEAVTPEEFEARAKLLVQPQP